MVWQITSLAQGIRTLSNIRRFPTPEAHHCDQVIANFVELYAEAFCACLFPRAESVSAVLCRVMTQATATKVAMQSLMDFRATAAIGKELIFHGKTGSVADLGAGSGILGVCAGIGVLRSGAEKVKVHCVENSADMVAALCKLAPRLRPRIDMAVHDADITAPETIRPIADTVRVWVSETINSDTLPLRMERDELLVGQGYHSLVDPYPKVLKNLLRTVPDFASRVRAGESVLFPDIVNDAYRADGKNGWLKLRTSKSHTNGADLRTVGVDFKKLTSQPVFRWP